MSLIDLVHQYNKQTGESLQMVYDALNKGQRKKLLKNDTVRALFEKYKVNTEDETDGDS